MSNIIYKDLTFFPDNTYNYGICNGSLNLLQNGNLNLKNITNNDYKKYLKDNIKEILSYFDSEKYNDDNYDFNLDEYYKNYSHDTLIEMAYLSFIIYETEGEYNDASVDYLIKYDNNKNLIIVFKGTSSIKNIIDDLKQGTTENYHKKMFILAIKYLFRNCNDMLNKIIKTNKENKKIYITGHSLGGGITTYLMIIIRYVFKNNKDINNNNCYAYVFGCPPVIPKKISKYISQYIYSVINDTDIITRLSLGLKIVKTHYNIHIDNSNLNFIEFRRSDNSFNVTSLQFYKIEINDHSMISYLKTLIHLKDRLLDLKLYKTDKPITKYHIPSNLTSPVIIVPIIFSGLLLLFIIFMLIKYRRRFR